MGARKGRANHGMILSSTIFNIRTGSRTVCLSIGRCLTSRHRNARGSGRHGRITNSAHGLGHRGNANNTHYNDVGSPLFPNNNHVFNPRPHSCDFGLGGGLGRLTHHDTLACGTRTNTVDIIRALSLSTPGAGTIITLTSTLGITSGGILLILPRSGTGLRLSYHGLPCMRPILTRGIYACSIVGTSTVIVIRNTRGILGAVLTWGHGARGKGCCWTNFSQGGSSSKQGIRSLQFCH